MTFESKTVILPIDNIDTDQIIPARFLKTVNKASLAATFFAIGAMMPPGIPNPISS